jgi:hypothetical protein
MFWAVNSCRAACLCDIGICNMPAYKFTNVQMGAQRREAAEGACGQGVAGCRVAQRLRSSAGVSAGEPLPSAHLI